MDVHFDAHVDATAASKAQEKSARGSKEACEVQQRGKERKTGETCASREPEEGRAGTDVRIEDVCGTASENRREGRMSRLQKELARLAPWGWDPHVKQHPPGSAFQKDFSQVSFATEMLFKGQEEEEGNGERAEKRKRPLSPEPSTPGLVTPGKDAVEKYGATENAPGVAEHAQVGEKAKRTPLKEGECENLHTPDLLQVPRRLPVESPLDTISPQTTRREQRKGDGSNAHKGSTKWSDGRETRMQWQTNPIDLNCREQLEDVAANLLDEFESAAQDGQCCSPPISSKQMRAKGGKLALEAATSTALPLTEIQNAMPADGPQRKDEEVLKVPKAAAPKKPTLTNEGKKNQAEKAINNKTEHRRVGKVKLSLRGSPTLMAPPQKNVRSSHSAASCPATKPTIRMQAGKENAVSRASAFTTCQSMSWTYGGKRPTEEVFFLDAPHKVYRPIPRIGKIEVVERDVAMLRIAKSLVVPDAVAAAAKAPGGAFRRGCAVLKAMDDEDGWKY